MSASSAMPVFDTLQHADFLKKAGFTDAQARAQVHLAAEIVGAHVDRFATKDDLRQFSVELRGEIGQLRSEIGQINANLGGDIKQLDTTLSGRIEQIDTTLSGRIEQLDTTLSGKIEQLDTTLSGRIEQLDTRLTGEIRQVAAELILHRWVLGLLVGTSVATMWRVFTLPH